MSNKPNKAPKKYDGKHGLLPGFKRDPSAERRSGERRLEEKSKILVQEAKKKLKASGFSMDRFMGEIKNYIGRK